MRKELMDLVKMQLLGEAASRGTVIDESCLIELDNYSRHHRVTELPDDKMLQVITTIGKLTLEIERKRVGGKHVRDIVRQLCNEAMSDCSRASDRILELYSRGVEPTYHTLIPGEKGGRTGSAD